MLEVSEREESVVALHLLIGPLKTRSGLEQAPSCELSTYQSISRWHSHCAIGAGYVVIDKRSNVSVVKVFHLEHSYHNSAGNKSCNILCIVYKNEKECKQIVSKCEL